eukprot:COSAG01_NODE_6643_length_3566_cov_20.896164_2_plen_84_part_00
MMWGGWQRHLLLLCPGIPSALRGCEAAQLDHYDITIRAPPAGIPRIPLQANGSPTMGITTMGTTTTCKMGITTMGITTMGQMD